MKKKIIYSYLVFAIVTVVMPFLSCITYAIFWPQAYAHIFGKMLPFTIATFLFYLTANLLTLSDLKQDSNRCYSYCFNTLSILFPITSFVIHSNIEILDGYKILFECKMGIGNMLMALLVAEFCRRYLMKTESDKPNDLSGTQQL